jgi:putative polyhydroxyalkanoate system protein
MADIHIHRQHTLGLDEARKVASQWVQTMAEQFEMACAVSAGQTCDTIDFVRSGVTGRLIVSGDHFDLHAKLGFLLSAFRNKIQAEIEKNLDELLTTAHADPCQSPPMQSAD